MVKIVIASAVLALACEGPSTGPDASLGDVSDFALVTPPTPPSAPSPPSLACTIGHRVPLEGAAVCEPWATSRPRCAPGQRVASGVGCVPIAGDCAGEVPVELAAGAVLVSPGSTGGDGTLAHPFGTIDEAVVSGALVIALAPGMYMLPAVLSGVTIAGTCPVRTVLRTEVQARLSGVTLRRLTVTGAGSIMVPPSGSLTLESVEVAGLMQGLALEGALSARRSVFRDQAIAITGLSPGAVTLEDVAIEHVMGPAIDIVDNATPLSVVHLTRVVIDRVAASATNASTVLIDGVLELSVAGLVIEDVGGHGLLETAQRASITELVVRRAGGAGLGVAFGTEPSAMLHTTSSVWIDHAGGGIAFGPGTHMANDLVVTNVSFLGIDTFQASATIDRVLVDGAASVGADVSQSTVTIRDLVVRNVIHQASDDGGGLLVEDHSSAVIERARFEHTEHYGLAVTDPSTADVSDVEIAFANTLGSNDGYGTIVILGSTLTLTRASIHDVQTAALAVQGATLHASDVLVRHVTSANGSDGVGLGAGIEDAIEPAPTTVTLERVDMEAMLRWGVVLGGHGVTLDAHDVAIRGTQEAACCDDRRGGSAWALTGGARVHVERFIASGSEHAGLVVTEGVDADFSHGSVELNAVGLVVSPSLSVNTGASPGLALHDVALIGNAIDEQLTDTTVDRPTITLH